jgi:hypothetical protein
MIDPAVKKRLDEILAMIAKAKAAMEAGKPFMQILSPAAMKVKKFAEDVQSGKIQTNPELDMAAEKMLGELMALAQIAQGSERIVPFRLEDIEVKAQENPETFPIPDLSDRMNLQPKDFAKLIFKEGENGERMWVQVDQSYGDGAYLGILKNQPVTIRSIRIDDPVRFFASNVADIHKAGHSWD